MYSNDRTRHHPSSRRHKPSSRSITHSRSRSRSPSIHRDDGDRKRSRSHRHRDRDRDIEDSRDKKRKGHHHHHHHRSRKHEDRPADPPTAAAPQPLPFGSRQLTKRDLAHYEPVLGMYLDIQKNLILEDLSETEVKGRWKSFLGKWNRGELAEGWYDPSTLEKARTSSNSHRASPPVRDRTRSPSEPAPRTRDESMGETSGSRMDLDRVEDYEDEDEDEESYGPRLPQQQQQLSNTRDSNPRNQYGKSGPTIPKTEDLQIQRELTQSAHRSERSHSRSLHHEALSSHKSALKNIQEEVAPRAEPGTHERRLEKRREKAAANRSFAQSARGGSPTEGVADDELMGEGGGGGGGAGDSLEVVKREREKETRKKNDRELRREEILRARVAEREERMEAYRRKEDETMSVLKALAKQRFG